MTLTKIVILITIVIALFITGVILYFLSPSFRTKKYTLESHSRNYLIHVPRNQDISKKLPLVVALHAYTDNPRTFEAYTRLSAKADQHNFIIVYPYGTQNPETNELSWNASFCCDTAQFSNVDDVKFLDDLIDEINQNYPVDLDSLYGVGFSNGAMMTYRLATQGKHNFKKIAINAGTMGGKLPGQEELITFSPKSPIPEVLMLHGAKDTTVPFDGGLNNSQERVFLSFAQSQKIWLDTSECSVLEPKPNKDYGVVMIDSYTCQKKPIVTAATFPYSGHTWFGSVLEWKVAFKGRTQSATDLIADFFFL